MDKKGQVALFLIIGIIIIASVILFFSFNSDLLKSLFGQASEIENIPSQFKPINDYIDSCLSLVANEGVHTLGQNGGFFYVPENRSIIWYSSSVPYYYLNKQTYIPKRKDIQTELNLYISKTINNCLNFTDFTKQGFNIKHGNPIISAIIQNKSIEIGMKYSVTIEKSNISTSINLFNVSINSNFGILITNAEKLVNDYSKKPGYICFSCVEEITNHEGNISIDVIPHYDPTVFENDIIWFLLEDNQYKLNKNQTLTLRFVVEQ